MIKKTTTKTRNYMHKTLDAESVQSTDEKVVVEVGLKNKYKYLHRNLSKHCRNVVYNM